MSKGKVAESYRNGLSYVDEKLASRGCTARQREAAKKYFAALFFGPAPLRQPNLPANVMLDIKRKFCTAIHLDGLENLPGQQLSWFPGMMRKTEAFHARMRNQRGQAVGTSSAGNAAQHHLRVVPDR